MDEQYWYFTFMQKQSGLNDKYVKIYGTFNQARLKMFKKFGSEWFSQYNEKEFMGKPYFRYLHEIPYSCDE